MFNVNPFNKALGAEITGIELGDLDNETLEALKAALFEHGVLCIRNQQNLTPAGQINLSNQLGNIHQHILDQFAAPGYPEILVLSNETDEKGSLIGIKDGAQYWHSDTSYEERPLWISVLRAGKLPEKDGKILGDTMFVSTWKSYEALSEEMKQRLDKLNAVHSYTTFTKARQGRENVRGKTTQEQKDRVPDSIHPIVRTHPINKRKCIYVNEGFTIKIDGLPEDESRSLLEKLFEHIKKPEFIYRHNWQPGDVLIWDNPQTQHCAIGDYGNYDPPLYRTMYRTAVKGMVPF